LFREFKSNPDLDLNVDLNQMVLHLKTPKITREIPFQLTKFQRDVIKAGSWVEFAASKY